MFKLSDADSLVLSQLLVKYFADCIAEDPGATAPGQLTVQELLEDLAMSTTGPIDAAIQSNLDAILAVFN